MDPQAPILQKTPPTGRTPLHWLISGLIVVLVIGAASVYYLVTKDNTNGTAVQTATATPGVTTAQALDTDTVISGLSTQLNKEITSMSEDQNSNEDTVPSSL